MPSQTPYSEEHREPEKSAFFHSFPPIPRAPIKNCLVVLGPDSVKEDFSRSVQELTGSRPAQNFHVDLSPQGGHLKVDAENSCGITESGSKIVYSPTHSFQAEHSLSPSGHCKEIISLYILRRQQDHQAKQRSTIFTTVSQEPMVTHQALSAIATNTTYLKRPSRKKVPAEKRVVGLTAKQLIIDYLHSLNINIPITQIEQHNWNLCHLLSFACFYHAMDINNNEFDTQVRENLFVGSRVLNENMMRIENVLLQFLKDNAVREIHGMTLHSEFENSHVLSALTLKIKMVTHDNRIIQFQSLFDVSDNRKIPHENTTAYYAFLKAIINQSSKNNIPCHQHNPSLFTPKRRRREVGEDNQQPGPVARQLFSST